MIKKFNDYVRNNFLLVLSFTGIMGAIFAKQSQDMKLIVLFQIPNSPWKFDMPTLALFFMMFATSIHCKVRDFKTLSKAPKSFLLGLVQFYMILPILAWCGAKLGILLLGPAIGPQIGAGIALVALMPVAAISNLWNRLVKGNVPLLLVFLTLTTALNIFSTPFFLSTILGMAKSDIKVPTELLVGNLLIAVIFPLTVGMLMRQFFENFVLKHQDLISLFGVLGLHIAFFANSGNAIPILGHMSLQYLLTVIALTVALCAVSGFIAYHMALRMGLKHDDHGTIAVSGAMRSNGIALVVGMKTFPGLPLVTVPAAIYSFCQHIIAGKIAKALEKREVELAALKAAQTVAAEKEHRVTEELVAIQSFDSGFILQKEALVQSNQSIQTEIGR